MSLTEQGWLGDIEGEWLKACAAFDRQKQLYERILIATEQRDYKTIALCMEDCVVILLTLREILGIDSHKPRHLIG